MSLKKPHELEEGMVLSSDVFNLDGQILFKKGVELENRHVDILQMWGIPNVEIEDDDEEEERINLDQFSPSILEKAERVVNERFKLVKSTHPAVEIIRKFCIQKEAIAAKRKEDAQ